MGQRSGQPLFVVQEHHARRLHWDFRLQHGDVLWSWAVPKGPSMEVGAKRLAVRTEDHPLAYAAFEGDIPEGNYGAGRVERWDIGTWTPPADVVADLARGELKFRLAGKRLAGSFVLIRMKQKQGERGENWLLIKERDGSAEQAERPARKPAGKAVRGVAMPPLARKAALPKKPRPQLATAADRLPSGGAWLHEIKFDGYRLLAVNDGAATRLLTRSLHDWSDRLPVLARGIGALDRRCVIDGELVAFRDDGRSDFGALQARLAEGKDRGLVFQAFDLLHLDGYDLTKCRLDERKRLLEPLLPASSLIRFTAHLVADPEAMRREACAMGLEGIISKRIDAPYVAGRTQSWIKLKCEGRDEFIVLGWTSPAGSRVGIGALHVGHRDEEGRLHYAGGVGTGFDDRELARLAKALRPVRASPPSGMVVEGAAPESGIRWVEPRMVVEVRYAGWTDAGRLRHAVFLGERVDKPATDVVMAGAGKQGGNGAGVIAVAPRRKPAAARRPAAAKADSPAFVVARPPGKETAELEGVRLTHPSRQLWPGITKLDLAQYWIAVADHALPVLARRPLALVRFPSGIDGEHFFQKHAMRGQPHALRSAEADGDPYLAIDDRAGLVACAQLSAIELHAWGATEDDPDRPDQLVFDLDPGEGVAFTAVVRAAGTIRKALAGLKLAAFCRTTGGKGLHVLVPLTPKARWPEIRDFAKGFAEALAAEMPREFVTTLAKSQRQGRILIDWLRNGRGATAIGSFSPRGRPGAMVATPLAWSEVTAKLDPKRFTIATVPARLAQQRKDPWDGFDAARRPLPRLSGGRR